MLKEMIVFLKEKRSLLQWTQRDLSSESAISQTVISRIENGHDTGSIREFFMLLETLDIDRDEFVERLDLISPRKRLDDARKNNDFMKMKEILKMIPSNLREKNKYLHTHCVYHEALIDYEENNKICAYEKLNDIQHVLENDSHSKLLLSEIHLALGVLSLELNLDAFKHFKKSSELLNTVNETKYNFERIVKVRCNLAATYCRRQLFHLVNRELNQATALLKRFESTYFKLEIEYARLLFYINTHHKNIKKQYQYILYLLEDYPNEKVKQNLSNIRI